MKSALASFESNLLRARDMLRLYVDLSSQSAPTQDLTDLMRAALVQGVSALDHFIHEIALIGMLEIQKGNRAKTPSFSGFTVTLSATQAALSNTASDNWLSEAVRNSHSWQTFQHPDKIADAVRLISSIKLWDSVSLSLGKDAKVIKSELIAIVDRRNKIAHEADMDPTFPGLRWPITPKLVQDALDYIEKISRAIFGLL